MRTRTPRTHHQNVTDAAASANGQPVINERADEKAAAAKADEKPSVPKETFWEQLRGLGDRWQTEDYTLYCYRLWPVTDSRNPERFLCKLAEPIDEDFLLKNYGSGKYLLMLNQHGKRVRTHVANPHNPQHPPAVHPNEVVASDPVNKVYFEVWAAPKDGRAPATAQGGQESAATETNTILNTVLAKTGAFDPKLAEMWEKTAKERDDLSKALAAKNAPPDLLELVKTVKDLLPSQPAPAEKPDALAIIAALKSMQPDPVDPLTVLQQAKEIFAPAPHADAVAEDLARFEKFLSIADKLAGWRGAVGPRGGWDIALDAARDVALPAITTIGGIIQNAMAFRHGQPIPNASGAPAVPPAWDPYRNQAATQAYAQTLRQQTPQQTPPTTPPPATPPPAAQPGAPPPPSPPGTAEQQLLGLFQQYGQLVLNALNNGTPGYEFADYVIGLLGNATHAVIANYGQEVLVSTMMQIPEFQVFGQPRLTQFAVEFINPQEFAENEDDADEASATARRK